MEGVDEAMNNLHTQHGGGFEDGAYSQHMEILFTRLMRYMYL